MSPTVFFGISIGCQTRRALGLWSHAEACSLRKSVRQVACNDPIAPAMPPGEWVPQEQYAAVGLTYAQKCAFTAPPPIDTDNLEQQKPVTQTTRSWTLSVWQSLFGNTPFAVLVVHFEGRQYPVQEFFLADALLWTGFGVTNDWDSPTLYADASTPESPKALFQEALAPKPPKTTSTLVVGDRDDWCPHRGCMCLRLLVNVAVRSVGYLWLWLSPGEAVVCCHCR